MRLKSFTAKTMRDAMDMVKEALGDDAVIVATREEKDRAGNPLVHITAAVEKDMPGGSADSAWDRAEALDESGLSEEITDALLRHTVPEEVLDQIVSTASMIGMSEARPAFMAAIESLFKFDPLPILPEPKPMMMIGAPGAGKTLATAKIAARGAMRGLNVAVITTDTERAGGREQLEAFTRLMDIKLHCAREPLEMKELLLSVKDADQILIDTAGANPFDHDSVKNLAGWIRNMDLTPVMVLPANTHAEEASDMAEIFSAIGAQRLFVSRIDVARRLGSLLSAAYAGGLSFCDISATPKVADGLSQLNAKRLTQLLMPRANTSKMGSANPQRIRKAG